LENKKELLSEIKVLKKLTEDKEIRIICGILEQMINETNKEIMGFRNENS